MSMSKVNAPFNWQCPHCHQHQTVTEKKFANKHVHAEVNNHKWGDVGVGLMFIGCSNNDCKELSIIATIIEDIYAGQGVGWMAVSNKDPKLISRIYPKAYSKPQPEHIPFALREDYMEACLICNDSPKASATLARRCLQGMIRDFCGIRKGRLVDEINALRKAIDEGVAPTGVTPDSVDAIDHVRGIGNIGAHMEKDINLIVPVEPSEAQILIELIESLFDEWYVAREKRRLRFDALAAMAEGKRKLIENGRTERGPEALPSPEQDA